MHISSPYGLSRKHTAAKEYGLKADGSLLFVLIYIKEGALVHSPYRNERVRSFILCIEQLGKLECICFYMMNDPIY